MKSKKDKKKDAKRKSEVRPYNVRLRLKTFCLEQAVAIVQNAFQDCAIDILEVVEEKQCPT